MIFDNIFTVWNILCENDATSKTSAHADVQSTPFDAANDK